MVARSRRTALLTGVTVALSILATFCEKVPLFAPNGSTIVVSILPGANGTLQIVAQVIEPAGTPPHSGTHVSFSTTLGTVQPSEVLTDINGRAAAAFQSAPGESGFATISAVSGGVKASACCIAVGSAAVGAIALSANPGNVSARGGSSTITAHVTDGGGNAIGGIPVSFTTDVGTVSPAVASTDANGNAQTTLTTSRDANVTATAGVTIGSDGKAVTPISAKVAVKANALPTVTITPPTTAPTAGLPATFAVTAAATTPAIITSIVVNWGDGTSSPLAGNSTSVSHVFNSPGTYTVSATATDSNGEQGSASTVVVVGGKTTPAVALTATPNPSTIATQPVTFTATVTQLPNGVTVDHFEWSFGDTTGRSTTGNSTTHAYAAPGTYSASVTAVMSDGSRSTSSIDVKVNP